ncbi:MarR family winged helix-turn-helix transcriptional regulator [Solicola sp. PLA-1-18]|uniref:MarR family winged helix-turn-helix transcriptional regulator n=1 Tax=Solicola sp. PLA-1-18 TaxID=3380532 RepID=UPI003B7B2A58
MISVKDDLPDHILALLGYALDGLRRDVERRGAGLGGLRSSQVRLMSLTPVEGMRVTDLAERVGMTKQALGEFANTLEEQGLLETVRDEKDRRARILRPTARGRRAVESSEAVIAEVEDAWRARLGEREWDALREALAALAGIGRELDEEAVWT